MKISKDKKFAMFNRSNGNTGEKWTEILNLTKISSIQERRYGKGVYNNDPGRRNGYLVFTDGGGEEGGFWINDYEFDQLIKLGLFGEFSEIK